MEKTSITSAGPFGLLHLKKINMLNILVILSLLINFGNSLGKKKPPDSNAFHVVVQEDKFLWIGSEKGLIKYNVQKNESVIYTKQNSKLPSNSINCIIIDNSSNKWIGTDAGLVKFNNYTWEVFDFDKKYPPSVIDLDIDKKGHLWILTFSNAIYKSDEYGFKHIEIENFIKGRDWGQKNILVDNQNIVWVLGLNGLAKYDGKWEILSKNPLPKHNYDNLYKDYMGNLWITQRNLVYWYFDSEFHKVPFLSNKGIEKILIVDSLSIFAQNRNGIVYFKNWRNNLTNPKTGSYTPKNSGLPSTRINDLLIAEKNMWICTDDGFAKFDGKKWEIFNLSKFQYIKKN